MIVRRIAIASILATGALAFAGCGMMGMSDNKMGGAMTVPLSGQNEVPPNASGGSGTAKVELDGNVIKWTVTYSGTTGPVTAGHFHGPAAAGRQRRRRRAVRRPARQPDRRLGDADAGAGRPGSRQASGTSTCTPPPTRAASCAARSSKTPAFAAEAPPVTPTAAPSLFPPRAGAARAAAPCRWSSSARRR